MSGIFKPVVNGTIVAARSAVRNLYQDVLNQNYNALFGTRSIVSNMLRAMQRIFNLGLVSIQVDVIPLADAVGSDFTSAITFTGPATAAGSVTLTVGSDYDHTYTVSFASGATADSVSSALAAAISADTFAPFIATDLAGVLTIVHSHTGVIGNDLTIKMSAPTGGVTWTIANTPGTGVTTTTNIFNVIGDTRYQRIVWPSSQSITDVETFLEARFNSNNRVLDGVAVITKTDTTANLKTLGNAQNSKVIWYLGNQLQSSTYFKGSLITEIDEVVSAVFAAICALRLTDGANISNFITAATGSNDETGGMHIASFPYFNTLIPYLNPCDPTLFWNESDQSDLVDASISIFGNNIANNAVILSDTVTTWKTDAQGVPNTSFKYLEYVDTASVCREYIVTQTRANYAQTRLTQGDLVPSYNMANAQLISSYIDGLYANLASMALVPDGENARKFFKANKTVTLNYDAGSVSVYMLLPLVTQLRRVDYTIQIAFDINV